MLNNPVPTTNEIKRTSNINFEIGLNEKSLPVSIQWKADDSPNNTAQNARAIMLSMWDGVKNQTFRLDLWTPEMTVEEMQYFVFETLMMTARTIEKATGSQEDAKDIETFAHNFAKKHNILNQPS